MACLCDFNVHLLGLLYHTAVDRKDIFACAVLSAAHALD